MKKNATISLISGVSIVWALFLCGCVHYKPQPLSAFESANAFEARRIDDTGLKQFIQKTLPTATTNWPPKAWNFETLTLVALYYHPSLEVARAQWNITTAGIRTAGGRLNPILSVVPGYSMNPSAGLSPWLPLGTLDIPIETAHKRKRRLSHASELAQSARLNIYITAWQVRAAVHGALIERNYVQRRFDLLQKQVQDQQELVTLLEQRLASGTIAAPEIAPAHVLLLKALADLAAARNQLATSGTLLAGALGLPLRALDGISIDAGGLQPTNDIQIFTSVEARSAALQTRPDIMAALAEYAASESALRLEIARQYPDLHLSPGYQFDQGEHKWSLGISVELPVLNRNQGPIAEALAKRNETAARFLALQAKVIGEIDRALQGYNAAQEQLHNSETLLITQQKQVVAQQAALQAGGADRFEVTSSRLEASITETTLLDAQYKMQQSLAQLEDAFQIPVNALRTLETNPRIQARTDH